MKNNLTLTPGVAEEGRMNDKLTKWLCPLTCTVLMASATPSICTASTGGTAEPSTSTATPPRFKLTAGMGYRVCEAYLKHLNAIPRDEGPPVCDLKLSPKLKNISLPDWKEIDWRQHLDWMYFMDRNWLSGIAADPKVQKQSFEEWQQQFAGQIESGERKPRLRRATVTLNEHGPETVFEYDTGKGVCTPTAPTKRNVPGGYSYFMLREVDGKRTIELIESGWKHLLLFENRPFFVGISGDGTGNPPFWHAYAYTVHPKAPEAYPGQRKYQVSPYSGKLCHFVMNK
jgi:hypothetical protein